MAFRLPWLSNFLASIVILLHLLYNYQETIKKAYRKFAIEYHPDKIPKNATEEEREQATSRFLSCQEAYETLSDPSKKALYDLSLSGSHFAADPSLGEDDKYSSSPLFNMRVRTKKFKLDLDIHFPDPVIPDVEVDAHVSLNEILNQVEQKNVSYFHRLTCPFCKGNGGLNGECETCSICSGSGVAKHMYAHKNGHFDQETVCTCQACEGRGCVRVKRCSACGGSGLLLTEAWMMVHLPLGFRHKQVYVYPEMGHQNRQGRHGNVVVRLNYQLPEGVSLRDEKESADLLFNTTVPIELLMQGGHNLTYLSLCGRSVNITTPAVFSFGDVEAGYNEYFPGLGVYTGDVTEVEEQEEEREEVQSVPGCSDAISGADCVAEAAGTTSTTVTKKKMVPVRGDLYVNVKPSWTERDVTSVTSLLQDSELSLSDPIFARFFAVLGGTEQQSPVEEN